MAGTSCKILSPFEESKSASCPLRSTKKWTTSKRNRRKQNYFNQTINSKSHTGNWLYLHWI